MIHSKPRCFECGAMVSSADLVFAPLCGSTAEHDECGSAVWHPLCLMEYRESLVELRAQHEQMQTELVRFFRGVFGDDDRR